jgi:transcriptional regulator with XRE-family HTH domain
VVSIGTQYATPSAPPDLTIRSGEVAYTTGAGGPPVIIGREPPAEVVIDDPRISRTHLRLQPDGANWVAVDKSSNGTYLGEARQSSFVVADGMTVKLGDVEGIPVTFEFVDAPAHSGPVVADQMISPDDQTVSITRDAATEGIVRAGAAVAARRAELGIAQRDLARNKILNAGALIAFEKGRSWPHKRTLAKLEEVLQWPPGMISRIRYGTAASDDDTTAAMTNSVQAPLMAQTVELALGTLNAAMDNLPDLDAPDYGSRVGAVLADLRRLEAVAANAARSARGAPEIAIALSTVRKRYDELMLRAARSPQATLGQRLYAARRRAALTIEEVANATDVPADVIATAEADGQVGPHVESGLEAFVGMLTAR